MPALEITSAAPRLGEIAAGVAARAERVTLLDGGAPVAVLVAPQDLRALVETVELLSDPEAMRRIRAGEDDFGAGDVVAGSDLGMLDPERQLARPGSQRPASRATGPEGYWELAVSGHARRAIEHLASHAARTVTVFLFDRLVADPLRAGVELRGGLSRRFVARVDTEKVIYRLDSVKRSVRVIEVLRGGGLPGQPAAPGQHW